MQENTWRLVARVRFTSVAAFFRYSDEVRVAKVRVWGLVCMR
jgi:hypothetical protein